MTRVVVLALALLLASGPSMTLAASVEAPRSIVTAEAVSPQDPTTLIFGDDACAVLTDDEILRATEGDAILSRTPGPQALLPAGCAWDVAVEGALAPVSIYFGVAPRGGRQEYDRMVPFEDMGIPISGVGEEAIDLGFGSLMAVDGDTAISIQTLAFGGGRPDVVVSRALGWVALTRLASRPPLLATAALDGPGVLPTDQPSLDAVAAIRTPAFGEDAVAATIGLLASVGIEVVDPVSGARAALTAGVASPVKVMDFQARSLAVEVWSGAGLTGAALDELLEVPGDTPLTSSILAGWLAAVDTPNARLGRALMAGQDVSDPTRLAFPALALLLFSADIVADTQAAADEPTATSTALSGRAFLAAELPPPSGLRTAQLSPCSAAQSFVDDVISTIFGVLKLPVPGNVAGAVVVSIWNWLVSRGEAFVRSVVAELTAPVISIIRDLAGLVALIGQVGAVAITHSVAVSPTVRDLVLPMAPAPPIEGAFEAIVTTAAPDWPDILKSCARTVNVRLPSLTAAGRPVAWGPFRYSGPLARSPLIEEGRADTTLSQGPVPLARKHFASTVETPEEARGPEHVVYLEVEARVVRNELKEGVDAIVAALFGHIPALIRPQVAGFLQPRIDRLLGDVVRLLDARGSGRMSITYHTRPDPSPPPDGTPGPSEPAQPVWVHLERAGSGEAIQAGRVLELVSCTGPYGSWSGVMRVGGLGPVPFSELPVAFSFAGTSGVQSVRTTTGGSIPWILPGITSDVQYELHFVVDGRTMVVTTSGTANERVLGEELIGDISASSGAQTLLIEPAPAGTCASMPTPSPLPTPPPTPRPTPAPTVPPVPPSPSPSSGS